jgi:spore maturation protein CgeB
MRILVSYRGIPGRPGWATGDYVVAALRRLGHQVYPYGNIYKSEVPIASCGPLTGPPPLVDLILWLECNDLDEQYIEILDLPCRRVIWEFDTSMHEDYSRALWKNFDHVFVANPRYAVDGARYLPYAIDPDRFHPGPQIRDVAIVGTPFKERVEFARAIDVPVVSDIYGDEYAAFIRSLRIHVHHHDSGGDGLIVCRIWETLASGVCLLTQDTPSIRRHFGEEHVALYHDVYDCRVRIAELLHDEDRRCRIREQGREEILAKHTWEVRVKELLEVIG